MSIKFVYMRKNCTPEFYDPNKKLKFELKIHIISIQIEIKYNIFSFTE